MSLQGIIEIVTGEAGALGILVILVFLLMRGSLVPKDYVSDLKENNMVLTETLQQQSESLEVLSKATEESLENSKVILKILSQARIATGVKGEPLDD